MSLFSSLFGGGSKQDYSQLIPEPPKFSLAQGSQNQYTGGIQDLIDVFNRRANGTDQFDALSYIYGPQATQLNQNYGIGTDPGDIYSSRTGALPSTLASLNKRGLLDTGTSGIIESQLRANHANELARAYGGAKTMQRQDIDNALNSLHSLFPERFQAQNIQNQVDYDNAMNSYNALLQRNQATAGQQASMDANKAKAWDDGIGLAMGVVGGGMSGMGAFGGAPLTVGNPFQSFLQGAGGSLFGQNPYQSQLSSIFGQRTSTGQGGTSPSSGFLRNSSGNQFSSNNALNDFASGRFQ